MTNQSYGVFCSDFEPGEFACVENEPTVTSTNESMPLLGSINEGQLGSLKAAEA